MRRGVFYCLERITDVFTPRRSFVVVQIGNRNLAYSPEFVRETRLREWDEIRF